MYLSSALFNTVYLLSTVDAATYGNFQLEVYIQRGTDFSVCCVHILPVGFVKS